MRVTDRPGYLPYTIFVMPDVHKPEGPAFGFTILHMAKPVCAYFDCTVILDRINLEHVFHELPCDVVPLCKHGLEISQRLLVSCQSFIVLKELKIVSKQRF